MPEESSSQEVPSSPSVAPVMGPTEASIPPESGSDVSRNTIVMLVLLTLVISILGTWTVLNEVSSMKVSTVTKAPTAANVKLNIVSEEQYQQSLAQTVPVNGIATGNVVFTIDKD